METKYVRVPFEVELAKKITNGEIGGKIVTRNGESARIVCFDRKDEFRPIIALVNSGDIEVHYAFSLNGKFVNDDVLDTHDLMLEIPEYMTFKDGDVLFFRGNFNWVFIYKKGDTKSEFYFAVDYDDGDIYFDDLFGCCRDGKELRLATEEEKQSLIDALKESKDQRAKEYLKRFFPNHSNSSNIGKNCEFKPFDKVLVRDNYKDSKWGCDLFSHKNEDGLYVCIGQIWENCIPYEGNEHLLETTENYE